MATQTRTAPPAATSAVSVLKPLADALAKHEEALEQILQHLDNTQAPHDDARKNLHSAQESVRNTRGFLNGLAVRPSGAMIVFALKQCQNHADMMTSLLAPVDVTAVPEASKKLKPLLREQSNFSNDVARWMGVIAQVPAQPTSVTASVSGIGQAIVTWTPPEAQTPDGSVGYEWASITDYAVTAILTGNAQGGSVTVTTVEHWVGRGMSAAGGTVSAIINGLSNGGIYQFTVRAVNDCGEGDDSAESNAVTLPDVLSAPTNLSATAGIGEATVTWTAPVSDPLAPITDSIVTAILMNADGTPSTSTTEQWVSRGSSNALVSGLADGGVYTFKVRAVNAIGEGVDSASSGSVTLPDVPQAPTNLSATRGIAEATVSWTAPASDPLAPITDYVVSINSLNASGSTVLSTVEQWVGGTTTAMTVPGLSNGGMYSFQVRAVNAVGSGAESPASAPITLPTVPDAPGNVQATPGIRQATVSWSTPAIDPLDPITALVITPTLNTAAGRTVGTPMTLNVTGATLPTSAIVTGLINGGVYTFTVHATNSIGPGPESAPSPPITLPDVPGKPAITTVTPDIGRATATWIAPTSDAQGNPLTTLDPITAFIVTYIDETTTDPARTATVNATTTTTTIDNLVRGHTYSFTVTARSNAGDGPASDPIKVLVLTDYPVYHSFDELLAASAVVAAPNPVDDDELIRHLRGAGKAFEHFSRDEAFIFGEVSDAKIIKLAENWGKAMDKIVDASSAADQADDGNPAVARLIRIRELLDRDYGYLRGGYSTSHPFDLGNL